jgi:hypothetical protein
MMHRNFYHWHNRVELKPDVTNLQARWDAAAKFSEDLSSNDACSLLRLALFGNAEAEFSKRFSEKLVDLEPTFLSEENVELLRVMATAALYSKMETESAEADAVALGLLAAAFQADRIQPVCKELTQRAGEYLAAESERMRPTPQVEGEYQALKRAIDAVDWAANPAATSLLGKAVLELGETMGRIAEENQFLWWLIGRRSSFLKVRREKITPTKYALIAATEAAERVALLPPPASVESLIGEALAHCSNPSNSPIALIEIIDAVATDCVKVSGDSAAAHELCPLTGLLAVRRAGGKIDTIAFEKHKLSEKLEVSPTEAASQYFREIMFLRALGQLG